MFSTILSNLLAMMLLQADFMRSIGKIYVVTIVCLSVWLGVAWFLLRLEKRIKRLEDQIK